MGSKLETLEDFRPICATQIPSLESSVVQYICKAVHCNKLFYFSQKFSMGFPVVNSLSIDTMMNSNFGGQ